MLSHQKQTCANIDFASRYSLLRFSTGCQMIARFTSQGFSSFVSFYTCARKQFAHTYRTYPGACSHLHPLSAPTHRVHKHKCKSKVQFPSLRRHAFLTLFPYSELFTHLRHFQLVRKTHTKFLVSVRMRHPLTSRRPTFLCVFIHLSRISSS